MKIAKSDAFLIVIATVALSFTFLALVSITPTNAIDHFQEDCPVGNINVKMDHYYYPDNPEPREDIIKMNQRYEDKRMMEQDGGILLIDYIPCMGRHYVFPHRIDGTLELDKPEGVMYDKNDRLVAVWFVTTAETPDVLTHWHIHRNLCLTEHKPNMMTQKCTKDILPPYKMAHLWVIDNEYGETAVWNPSI